MNFLRLNIQLFQDSVVAVYVVDKLIRGIHGERLNISRWVIKSLCYVQVIRIQIQDIYHYKGSWAANNKTFTVD